MNCGGASLSSLDAPTEEGESWRQHVTEVCEYEFCSWTLMCTNSASCSLCVMC